MGARPEELDGGAEADGGAGGWPAQHTLQRCGGLLAASRFSLQEALPPGHHKQAIVHCAVCTL